MKQPLVLISILAKEKAGFLPLYLECLYNLDYPRDRIGLYIRSNNNKDDTVDILRTYVENYGGEYYDIYQNYLDVEEKVEEYDEHEWNEVRFGVLGKIRQKSMEYAYDNGYDYYFVIDCDNFIIPETLNHLITLNKDIVGPLVALPGQMYGNFHHCIDEDGYYIDCDEYQAIRNRWMKGQILVNVIHCTYLINTDVIPKLTYLDGTDRHEYVIFSNSCRDNNIDQYIDNTKVWGYLTFHPNKDFKTGKEEEFRRLLGI